MGDEQTLDVLDRTISDKDSVYRLMVYKALERELGREAVVDKKLLIGYLMNKGLEYDIIYVILYHTHEG